MESFRHAARSRPDIQRQERFLATEVPAHKPPCDPSSAEPIVNAPQIGQIRARLLAGRVLEHFSSNHPFEMAPHTRYVKMRRVDIVTGNIGWIEVICGPMFSGKSEELIRRLRRAMIARKRVQVFKPVIDDRYSANEIVSHGDQRMKSVSVEGAAGVLRLMNWRTEVVGIDESNFYGLDLVDVANQLADSGKQVIIAGLDTDYMGRPFHPMPELLALAESITKTLAICVRCGNPAKHTQRLVESDDLIVVGAAGMYEARCRRCFEPGVPKQEAFEFARPAAIRRSAD